MIHLWYSNNLHRLVGSLVENLEQERAAAGTALHTSHIILPNRNIETWLTFEIARLTGIAANLSCHFLEDFLRSLLGTTAGAPQVLGRAQIQSLLISLLQEHDQDPQALPEAVRDYLSAGEGSDDETDLRRFQLSARLSRIFDEYSLSREEMLRSWLEGGRTIEDAALAGTEKWQSHLWRLLYGRGGRLDRVSEATHARARCYGDAFDSVDTGGLTIPGRTHLFGFSYVARTLSRVLHSLASRTELCVYALNPCMEFWEDVMTRPEAWRLERRLLRRAQRIPEAALREKEDPFDLKGATDTPALRLWGRPGRENIHLLNSLAECDFQPCFEEPPEEPGSLLAWIQRDILCREPERKAPPPGTCLRADGSLTVMACAGIQREVEVIANEIWSLMLSDGRGSGEGRLRFNDIAVIIADAGEFEAYRTHISSVFREIHDIPHNVTDLALSGDSRVVQAVELLLSLPQSRYTREDILGLVTHPAVLAKFPESDPDEWVAWCGETGIVHGIDHRDHLGTYIGKDLFNWDQGLRRLALGAFMSGDPAAGLRAATLGPEGAAYIPQEYPQGSTYNAAFFILIVRSLIADAEYARQARMSLSEWGAFLTQLVSCYVGTPGPEDEHVLSRCLAALSSLREADLDAAPVSFTIARGFALSSLSAITGARGQYLAGGVVVSSFLPMRPIPFRVVFIAGMGEGRFPAREVRNPLDLRAARRVAGDVAPRERDQYMFLETLISTRDRLYLSYVSRDGQTGEKIGPSSVIKELLFMIGRGYLEEDQSDALVVEHPLRRFDDAYFPEGLTSAPLAGRNFSPAAWSEARAVRFRKAHKPPRRQAGNEALHRDLRQIVPEVLRPLLGLCEVPDASLCPMEEVLSVSTAALRRFLECPLQGWASYRLGLRSEEPEDAVTLTDEPFSTHRAEEAVLLRSAFVEAWRNRPAVNGRVPLAETYGRMSAVRELKGTAPTGLFKAIELTMHLSTLDAWLARLGEAGVGRDAALEVFRFGRAQEGAVADRIFEPLAIDIGPGNESTGPVRAELHGRTEALCEELTTSVILLSGKAKRQTPKAFLRGFFDYLLLVASGRLAGKGFRAIAVFEDGFREARFGPLTREVAGTYLQTLAGELTGGPHAYLLPIDAVFTHRSGKSPLNSLGAAVRSLRDDPFRTYSSCFGPVPHPEDYEPPCEEEALEMVERRFGLYFRLLTANPAAIA